MLTPQAATSPQQGLCWATELRDGRHHWGHNGSDPGDPDDHVVPAVGRRRGDRLRQPGGRGPLRDQPAPVPGSDPDLIGRCGRSLSARPCRRAVSTSRTKKRRALMRARQPTPRSATAPAMRGFLRGRPESPIDRRRGSSETGSLVRAKPAVSTAASRKADGSRGPSARRRPGHRRPPYRPNRERVHGEDRGRTIPGDP